MSRTRLSRSLPMGLLAVTAVGALAAGVSQEQENQEIRERRFSDLVDRTQQEVLSRFHTYEVGLIAARGLVMGAGGPSVTYLRFRQFAESWSAKEAFPGARGFGFIRWIEEGAEESLVQSNRAQGRTAFRIRSLGLRLGSHFVIDYIEPEENNGGAAGLDIASETNRRDAALDAARAGRAVLTHPITLVQATGQPQQGFLLLSPIYHTGSPLGSEEERLSATFGWTYAPLLASEILDSIDAVGSQLTLQLSDVEAGRTTPFYDAAEVGEAPANGLAATRRLQLFGREWELELRARETFSEGLNLRSPFGPASLVGLLGLLLSGVLYVRMRDFRRRLDQAEERDQMAAIVDSSADAIIGTDLRGEITSWNAGAERLFGRRAADALGQHLSSVFSAESPEEASHATRLEKIREGQALAAFATRWRSDDQPYVDVSVAVSPIRTDGGRVVGASHVMRDIGAERRAEANLRALNESLERQVAARTADLEDRNARLGSAHDNLERVLDAIPNAILALNDEGLIERANATAGLLLRERPKELIGRRVEDFLPESQRAAYRATQEEFRDAPGPRPMVSGQGLTLLRRDGSEVPTELSLSPVTLVEGPRVLVSLVDVSERKEHELLIQSYSATQSTILDHVGYAIFALDPETNITLMNPEAEALSGYRAAELIGRKCPAFLLEPGSAAEDGTRRPAQTLYSVVENGKAGQERECVVVRANGDEVPALFKTATLRTEAGELLGYLAVGADLTERKRTEEELRLSTRAAESANRAKSEFLANMSHEIRTPMNAILGMAYLLQKEELSASARDTTKRLQTAGRALLAILNDILDFSKIEAGRLEIERAPFRLTDVLTTLAAVLSGVTGQKPVEVVIGAAPAGADLLFGDALRLNEILTNLAGNAIKFTERGEVVVSVEWLQRVDDVVTLRFAVEDTGIGIRPEQRAEIFSPFAQADTSITRRYGGTGLGLAITTRLVTLLGGTLELASEPGRGTRFWFDLPFEVAQRGQFARPETVFLRALVADDHAAAREALAAGCTSLGWHAVAVASGEAALVAAEAADEAGRPFDIFLLDWQMPGLDGLETATQLKQRKAGRAPIILLVTAAERSRLLAASRLACSADEVLSKPVTASTLLDVITQVKRTRGELAERGEQLPDGAPRLAGVRTLVVDDREVNREVAQRILESEGAIVRTAEDGQQALALLLAAPREFDIVLMDVQMPVMDGYQATRQIRQNPELRALPIIALTAGAFREQRDAAIAAGMDGFIAKAFDVGELIALINRVRRGDRRPASAAPPVREAPVPSVSCEVLPLLDVAHGLTLLRSDAAHRRVLGTWLRTHEADDEVLLAAVSAGKVEEARAIAHRLKGAAGSVALPRLAAQAAELEAMLMCGEDLDARAVELTETFRATRQAVREHLGPPPVPADGDNPALPPSPEASRKAEAALARLLGALAGGDVHGAENATEALAACWAPEIARPLRDALDDFDFERARATAARLAAHLSQRKPSSP